MEFTYQSIKPESFSDGSEPLEGSKGKGTLFVGPSFTALPPERVGLNGEYDYEGLAKRVLAVLHQTFKSEDIQNLKVSQRGRVVILKGKVPSHAVLQQVAEIAAQQNGAIDVETVRVKIDHPTV